MASERTKQGGTQGHLWGLEALELTIETARSQSLLAESLELLFPGQNLHFEEIQREGEPKIALGYLRSEFEKANASQRKELTPSARAYFCKYCDNWVKGSPLSEKDDDLDPTVYNLFCTICESEIGKVTGMRS